MKNLHLIIAFLFVSYNFSFGFNTRSLKHFISSKRSMIPTEYTKNSKPAINNVLEDIAPKLSGLQPVTDADFNSEVLTHAGLSVVFFTSHWCIPCRSMAMVVEDAKDRMVFGKNENVKFLSIDTDENPISSSEFQLRSIPSTMLFKNGRVVAEIVGSVQKHVLLEEIKKHSLFNLPDISVSSFE